MAIVKKYPSQVVFVKNHFENIHTVRFKSLKNPYKYYPGQFLHLALDEYDPSEGWVDSRCFSMQSAPADEYLEITYVVKGKFTNRMAQELVQGKKVTLKLPYGDLFIREHDRENSVFISGGTGITPFLSLFKSLEFKDYKNPILYAGFRDQSYNIYQNDLNKAKNVNSSLIVKYVYQNIYGLLDIKKILKENDLKSSFFISGPPGMIKSFKEFLIINDITEAQIFTDAWE